MPTGSPSSTIILGIDPGLADVGWGCIELTADRTTRLLDYGVINTPPDQPLSARLCEIHRRVCGLIDRYNPRAISIEALFFAKNVKTAMVVAHGRAAAVLAAGMREVAVFEYTPLQLKKALTGKGSAAKAQVQQMVKVVLGLQAIPQPDHAADALAAALCHAHSLSLRKKIASAKQGAGERNHLNRPAGRPGSTINSHLTAQPNHTDPQRAARKALLAQAHRRSRR
jgi:crossover junction endodeoxyribonuclease RuvC